MKVDGLTSLIRSLQRLRNESKQNNHVSVVVGYACGYALYVHENLEAAHGAAYNAKYASEIASGRTKSGRKKRGWKGKTDRGPNQQAKFLEQPARTMRSELGDIVRSVVRSTGSLSDGLISAGERLQAESQKLVPVETGNLKGLAFTEKE